MKCRICDNPYYKPLYTIPLYKRKLMIVQCLRCRFIFSDLSLDLNEIKKYYKQDYFEQDATSVRAVDRRTIQNIYESVLKDLGNGHGKTLLDVGCGYGEFMATAQKAGWKTRGIDISSWAARNASKKTSTKVAVGSIEHAKFSASSFDVMTAWDVIEHVINPRDFVRAIGRMLRKNGVFVLMTPNAQSMYHTVAHVGSLFGWDDALKLLYHFDHVSYFTKDSLTDLLTRENFSVQRIEYVDVVDHDTRFSGIKKLGIGALHALASLTNQQHSLLVYATPKK